MNTNSIIRGSYYDDWENHKDDLLWREFWAFLEIKRKWNWTNWFYQRLDKVKNEIVAPEYWSLFGGEGLMKLCIWISLLYSLHEGITTNLDAFNESKKIDPKKVFKNIPKEIIDFPAFKDSPFKDFRNAVFHCKWTPTLPHLGLDQTTTNKLDVLHNNIGKWINEEFQNCYKKFEKYYSTPPFSVVSDVLI